MSTKTRKSGKRKAETKDEGPVDPFEFDSPPPIKKTRTATVRSRVPPESPKVSNTSLDSIL